jgi:multifunctional methyltransferase subunit TRM112
MDSGLVTRLLPKLNYPALVGAVQEIQDHLQSSSSTISLPEIPAELPDNTDEISLEALHHVLFNVHVTEGFLICPDTSRKFPIKDGIPNMILHEDEL